MAALRQTTGAELIVVAMWDRGERAAWPEGWVTRWAAGRKVAVARRALVLLGTADGAQAELSVIAPVRQLAAWANLRFVALEKGGGRVTGHAFRRLGGETTAGPACSLPGPSQDGGYASAFCRVGSAKG